MLIIPLNILNIQCKFNFRAKGKTANDNVINLILNVSVKEDMHCLELHLDVTSTLALSDFK